MSKTNQCLTSSVKKLLKAVGVKAITYQELLTNSSTYAENPHRHQEIQEHLNKHKAIHWDEIGLIAVDDDALSQSTEDANELVLHELVHMACHRLGKDYKTEAEQQTMECIAQVGMFKLILVLGLNPAPYADRTLDYIKQFPKANFKRVEIDSDKAVSYLVKFLGLEKVA